MPKADPQQEQRESDRNPLESELCIDSGACGKDRKKAGVDPEDKSKCLILWILLVCV